jgi:hypothetical protein
MKKVISVGDEFTVDFVKNQKGGKPICRIEGIVCFIDSSERSFVAPCSSWVVCVKEIRDNFLIVTPLMKVRTAKENEQELQEKLEALRVKKEKKTRQKSGYQYKSFQEIKYTSAI